MENRKLIYMFGLLFSIVFASLYYFLFQAFLTVEDTSTFTFYYNQVGLYKSDENAQKVIHTLKEHYIDAYLFPQNDVNAIITGMSSEEEQTKQNQEQLKAIDMTFIEKSITTKQPEVKDALEAQDINKVLELINNESKGNEST